VENKLKSIFSWLLVIIVFAVVSYHLLGTSNNRAEEITQILDRGGLEFSKGRDLEGACPRTKNHMVIFCREGYFYHRALMDLGSDKTLREVVGLDSYRNQGLTSFEWATWAIAFGIAYGELDREVSEAQAAFQIFPPVLFEYFLDGWVMRYSQNHSGEEALRVCEENFGKEMVRVCAWGVGRALFYELPSDAEQMQKLPQVKAGYDFAVSFTDSDISESSVRIAHWMKSTIARPGQAQEQFLDLQNCTQENHLSECRDVD
jgi:hypothetical protein